MVVEGSLQVKPTITCKEVRKFYSVYDSDFDLTVSRSGNSRSCIYENLKSPDDVTKARESLTISNEDILEISFSQSRFSKFSEKFTELNSDVKVIEASQLGIKEIETKAFNSIKTCELINLSKNEITKLASGTFADVKIVNLDLSYNQIEMIDEKTFDKAVIKSLNLVFNKLKTVDFLNSFKSFMIVELGDNLLENIKIHVNMNEWIIPLSIAYYDHEVNQKIFLQNNKFKTFECDSNVALDIINIANNKDLTNFDLKDCEVDKIDVTNCESLRKISLNEHVTGLTATNTKLNDVEFSNATHLTSLLVANSSISRTALDNILKMENLTNLDLSFNNIGPVNITTFAKLKSLDSLHLRSTNISNIKFGTFSNKHDVQELDISGNNLDFFGMDMVLSMGYLRLLNLSGNALTSIGSLESVETVFTMLREIDLSDNKWHCNYLQQLIKFFLERNTKIVANELVENKPNVHGIACIHVEGEDDVGASIVPLKSNIEEKLSKLDTKLDKLTSTASKQQSFYENAFVVTGLVIVCIFCTIFIAMKILVMYRKDFSKSHEMRSFSERNLTFGADEM